MCLLVHIPGAHDRSRYLTRLTPLPHPHPLSYFEYPEYRQGPPEDPQGRLSPQRLATWSGHPLDEVHGPQIRQELIIFVFVFAFVFAFVFVFAPFLIWSILRMKHHQLENTLGTFLRYFLY